MSAATQILFNSPALHSLKRDQLVKLCKIHSLKANGKNKDIIERLQQHAKTLPPDDPLSIATRSDNPDAKSAVESEEEAETPSRPATIPRPSEQWEMVMDSIPEVDEETLRSNRGGNSNSQAGEFGTNGTKASTVTSSLKAIATSLGLKRDTSKVDATATSSMSSVCSQETDPSSCTLPTSDASVEDRPPVEPIPGQMNLQGMPAPAHARLSMTQAPTNTTIRLVSGGAPPQDILSPPRLKPFATAFDLVPATPKVGVEGEPAVSVWPPLSPPGPQNQNMYPSLAAFRGFGDLHVQDIAQPDQNDCSDMDIDVPGGLDIPTIQEPTPRKPANIVGRPNTGATPKSTEKPSAEPVDIFSPAPKPQKASARSRLGGLPRSEPFIFGSPLPQHNLSNRDFRSAAQSVLDEMNKRLADEGIECVDINVLQNREKQGEHQADDGTKSVEQSKRGELTAMFEKAHQDEFDKMESIVQYAQKRGRAEPIVSKKRKSSLVIKDRKAGEPGTRRRASGLRVASGASKTKVVPGGFGEEDDDDEEDVGQRRMSKRPRLEPEPAAEGEPQAPANEEIIPSNEADKKQEDDEEKEEERKQKERELIRRRLEYNKAKRRSSMGRPSLGRAPPQQKPKPTTRFGFLSTAKSIVQSVWNRGAGTSKPSQLPITKSAPRKEEVKPTAAPQSKKVAVVPGSSGPPPMSGMSQTKRVPSGGSVSGRPTKQNTASRPTLAQPTSSAEGSGSMSSRVSRAPIPSFNPLNATGTRASVQGGHSRNTSITGISSLGHKTGASGSTSRTSSLGTRASIRSSAANPPAKVTGSMVRSRPSSTLMAPTASSLAKMTRPSASSHNHENVGSIRGGGISSKIQTGPVPSSPATALGQITNSPRSPQASRSPTGKVFSQPLSPLTIRPPMSLTAAAESIAKPGSGPAGSMSSSKPPIPPKPKVLPGRRPRISRSKVIARLASQRAAEAGAASVGAGAGAGASTSAQRGKTRSSMGAGVAGRGRSSHGGPKSGDVLMSAKRRARQSEYARRRSRAIASEDGSQSMDMDE
ncbi:hypothetical protein ID866_9809 [Astraeus odoratus]|nr:hypothetical protein ID866_9809 [Astraeus odoratus]